MIPLLTPHVEESSFSAGQMRAEIAAVLAAPAFQRSPRLTNLLAYLCEKHFAGESGGIKEYNIATEVLGRPESFDPASDAIARVELHRLRKKLKEFYEGEGHTHPIRIFIPTGSYVPQFCGPTESAPPLTTQPPPLNPSESGLSISPEGEAEGPPAVTATEVKPALPRGGGSSRFRVALGAVLLVACVGGVFLFRGRTPGAPASVRPAVAAAATVVANHGSAAGVLSETAGNEVRILCGHRRPHIDRLGRQWGPDRFFAGGGPYERPRQFLIRTNDPALFNDCRTGTFAYDIPLAAGPHEMRLYFAETIYGPGTVTGGGENSRVFNVFANDQPLLENFDIISDAGGTGVADIRVFKDVSPAADGKLHLRFESLREQAIVSAIEILPAPAHRIAPIRITTQETPYTDSQGRIWMPDDYWSGGQIAVHPVAVLGTQDPDLYTRERYGNFSYAIPVAEGTYAATLYLAETYWGVENAAGGAGSRLFNIFCNGEALARNYDIFAKAAAARQLILHYDGLHPSAQGKLQFSFVPVKNYASLFALEVVDTSK